MQTTWYALASNEYISFALGIDEYSRPKHSLNSGVEHRFVFVIQRREVFPNQTFLCVVERLFFSAHFGVN